MMAPGIMRRPSSARLEVERAGGLLASASPEAFEQSSVILSAAAGELAEWNEHAGEFRGDAAALEEAWRLQNALRHSKRLLDDAAEYYAGWNRRRGSMSSGYTPQGAAAPVIHTGRICLQA